MNAPQSIEEYIDSIPKIHNKDKSKNKDKFRPLFHDWPLPFNSRYLVWTGASFLMTVEAMKFIADKEVGIVSLNAGTIFEGDTYKIQPANEGNEVQHEVNLRLKIATSAMIGAYVIIITKDGGRYFEYALEDELKRAATKKDNASSPWSGAFRKQMAKKFVIKRGLKSLMMTTPKLDRLIELDNQLDPVEFNTLHDIEDQDKGTKSPVISINDTKSPVISIADQATNILNCTTVKELDKVDLKKCNGQPWQLTQLKKKIDEQRRKIINNDAIAKTNQEKLNQTKVTPQLTLGQLTTDITNCTNTDELKKIRTILQGVNFKDKVDLRNKIFEVYKKRNIELQDTIHRKD